LKEAPLAVDRGGPKDSRGYAAGARCTLSEILALAVHVPDWDVSPRPVPDWPKGSRRNRVNVLTPSGDRFLFSMSTCYAEQFVQPKQAIWLANKKCVRGVAPVPSPLELLTLAARKYPTIPEPERGPKEIHKPSDGRRVLSYAHKEYSEFVPAGVWTLDSVPKWGTGRLPSKLPCKKARGSLRRCLSGHAGAVAEQRAADCTRLKHTLT
jgi:hypothetical protein